MTETARLCNIPQPNMAPQEERKAFQLIVEEGSAVRTDLDLGQGSASGTLGYS